MPGESLTGRQSRDDRRTLLSITVEIEDGRVEHLELREGDVPEVISTRFCNDHNLPLQFVSPLTDHITFNLKSIGKDENVSSRSPTPRPKIPREETHSPKPPLKRKPPTSPAPQRDKTSTVASRMGKLDTVRKYQILKKTLRNQKFNPRLLQHTFTFSSKVKGEMSEKAKSKRRDLSDKMKAICLRLYSDYLRHRQKVQEEARVVDEQYREKFKRDRPILSKRSKRLMKAREKEARQFHNYGELLYQEGLAREVERKKLIEKKQQEDEMNELKLISPKPEISKFAKQLKTPEGVWDRLMHDKQNQGHMQELRNELWEAKLMECTFKPRINYLQNFERRDVQTSTRFEQLFYDAEHRRRRQAEYMRWFPEGFTFQPQINKYDNAHAQQHGTSVFDRLLQYAQRITEKRQKLYESSKSKLVDPITGQELFRPTTGREPNTERNSQALPIGEFLYQMKFALENKRQLLMEREQRERLELARPHYVGERSEKLLDHLRERRLKQIFDHLDTDKDDQVDLETADTSMLTREVVAEIKIVKSMGEAKLPLSFNTFADLMEEAQSKIGSNGLHAVFKYRSQEERFPFQFKMCRLSKSLAATRRRKFSTRKQWYDLVLMDRNQRMERIENLRKERQKQEMLECTFSPAIHGSKAKKYQFPTMRGSPSGSRDVDRDKQEVQGFIFREKEPEVGNSGGKMLLDTFKGLAAKQKEKEDPEEAKKRETYLSDVPES